MRLADGARGGGRLDANGDVEGRDSRESGSKARLDKLTCRGDCEIIQMAAGPDESV